MKGLVQSWGYDYCAQTKPQPLYCAIKTSHFDCRHGLSVSLHSLVTMWSLILPHTGGPAAALFYDNSIY